MADASTYAQAGKLASDGRLKKNRVRPNTSGPTGKPAFDQTLYNFGNSNSTQVQRGKS